MSIPLCEEFPGCHTYTVLGNWRFDKVRVSNILNAQKGFTASMESKDSPEINNKLDHRVAD